MAGASPGGKPKKKVTVTWAQAFRDIVISGMARGQLLPLMCSLAVLLIIYRLPPEKLANLVYLLFSKGILALGWVVAVALVIGWSWQSRRSRRFHSAEYERITKEKNDCQSELNNKKFISSNDAKQ